MTLLNKNYAYMLLFKFINITNDLIIFLMISVLFMIFAHQIISVICVINKYYYN